MSGTAQSVMKESEHDHNSRQSKGAWPTDYLNKGEWTDDTSMALCLAESLIQSSAFDAADQMDRYVRWWKEGHLSSNGRCFDIGITIAGALRIYGENGDAFAGSVDPYSAGNGSLMRLAPVPLFYAMNPERAIDMCRQSSQTTHGALTCLDACRYFGALIVGALDGASKEDLLATGFAPVPNVWERDSLRVEIEEIAQGSFKHKEPPEIIGSGYVVKSLEAALWAFNKSSTFEEGCLLAVNLGDDADTTGAIFGQMAGAYYGVDGIPKGWRDSVAHSDMILNFADELLQKRIK